MQSKAPVKDEFTCFICICVYGYSMHAYIHTSAPEAPSPRRPARRAPWGNTNRVVSNRVVSKVPLYPSKTEIVIFFAGRNIPAHSNYRYIFLGPVFPPICKSGSWEQPRLIRPRLYASERRRGPGRAS